MATQDIVQQLVQSVLSNPQMLTSLMEHPYSTIGNLTNNNNVSKEEASQVVAATSALAAGQQVDFGNLASLATQLLGQSNGSVHQMSSNLLGSILGGGGAKASNGISADLLSNLAGVAFGGGKANNASAINLADGLDMGEIAALAGQFLGKPSAAAAQQQSQPVTLNMSQPQQSQGSGIDFATIAQIASTLLKH